MTTCRLHITGASGSGTTTLGRAVASRRSIPHHDTDDYYWQPTDPPFQEKRPVADRLQLMEAIFLPRTAWVLSGSVASWAEALIPSFDLVVYLTVPTDIRIARLREREARTYGAAATAPGGWRHDATEAFIEWAAHYEDGTREGRNRARHEAWLQTLPCPVLRLESDTAIDTLVARVLAAVPE